MTTKIKILIGVLVVGVVLIGVWWIWNSQIYPETQEVTITTDKAEYEQGETVKITLKNNLKESIFSHIGSGTPIFCIEYVERKTARGNWEKLLAQGQYPYVLSSKPRDVPKEIKPGQSAIFEWWKPSIFINETSKSIQAGPGIYRLVILY